MSIDATIATWKLSKKQITPTQKLILLCYADRAGESFECWPSNKRLSQDTGYDVHTICQNKLQLIEKGLISYTGEKKGRTKSIDVIRLNYVHPREGYVEELDESSNAQMPIASEVSNAQMPIAKLCVNAHTEPKRLEPKRINNIKEKIYKKEIVPIEYEETYFQPQEQESTSLNLSVVQLQSNNPHKIPIEMLKDWMANRKSKKSPITFTAWSRINKELSKCDNPVEAFEEMVAAGWQSIKAEWVNKKAKSSHFDNESTDWINRINEDIF